MGSPFQTGLFQYAVESARRNVVTLMTGDRYSTGLQGLLELPVATTRGHDGPSVITQQF